MSWRDVKATMFESCRRAFSNPCVPLFVLFLTLYVFSAGGHFYSPDEIIIYSTTKAIAEKGSLNIYDELNWFRQIGIHLDTNVLPEHPTVVQSQYGLLQPILAVPLYYLAISVGVDPMKLITLFYSPFMSALGVVLIYSILRRLGSSTRVSVVTAILYGTSTIAWPYAKFFYEMPTASATLLAATYFLVNKSRRYKSVVLSGLFTALTVFARITQVLVLPGMIFYLFLMPGSLRRRTLGAIVFMAPLLAGGLMYAFVNVMRTGSPLQFYGYGGAANVFDTSVYSTDPLIGIYGMLLSSGEGLFIYYPLCALGLYMLGSCSWPNGRTRLLFGWYFLSNLLFYSRVIDWHGWGAWGARYLVIASPYLILPCARYVELAAKSLSRKVVLLVLAAVGLFSNLMGVLINFQYTQDYLINIGAFINFPYPGIWIPSYSPVWASYELLWSPQFPAFLYPNCSCSFVYFLQSRFDLYFYAVYGLPALMGFLVVGVIAAVWLRRETREREKRPR